MSRALTGTIYYPNGTAWASGEVRARLMEPFETSTRVYPKTEITITLDANGQIPAGTQLDTPDTGTAHYVITTPDQANYHVYIATGAAVDLVTLLTIAGTAVAQDDLQTLLDAAKLLPPTNYSTTGDILTTDAYVRATGTITLTLPPAIMTQPPIIVKNVGTSLVVTIDGNGSETINGAATYSIYPDEAVCFVPIAVGQWDAV